MIRSQNQIKIESGSSSMSDLVFLLLIFFMLTSTLISPNAVKLFLPESNNKTMAKESVTVYIEDLGGTTDESTLTRCQFQVDDTPLANNAGEPLVDELKNVLADHLSQMAPGDAEAGVFVRADQSVDVQYIVNIIDAVNRINKELDTKHKVVLGTRQRS